MYRDREMEAQIENTITSQNNDLINSNNNTTTLKSNITVKGGELIMETIDIIENEIIEIIEWIETQKNNPKMKNKAKIQNPRLLNMNPYQYFIKIIKTIKSNDLEQSLLILSFGYVTKLIKILLNVSFSGKIMLCFILNFHNFLLIIICFMINR